MAGAAHRSDARTASRKSGSSRTIWATGPSLSVTGGWCIPITFMPASMARSHRIIHGVRALAIPRPCALVRGPARGLQRDAQRSAHANRGLVVHLPRYARQCGGAAWEARPRSVCGSCCGIPRGTNPSHAPREDKKPGRDPTSRPVVRLPPDGPFRVRQASRILSAPLDARSLPKYPVPSLIRSV